MIVLDAAVIIKLFKEEADSAVARALVDHLVRHGHAFGAPSVVRYETFAAALHVNYPFGRVADLFDWLQRFGFEEREPFRDELLLAEEIATAQAPGGGFADLFDSLYHAMALRRGGTFVTPDQRHIAKAGHRGAVKTLAGWAAA